MVPAVVGGGAWAGRYCASEGGGGFGHRTRRIAGLFELVLGFALLVGFKSRLSAFILCGVMASAYFLLHAPQGFYPAQNGGTAAIIFCFVFLYLAAAGGGPVSVDAARGDAKA